MEEVSCLPACSPCPQFLLRFCREIAGAKACEWGAGGRGGNDRASVPWCPVARRCSPCATLHFEIGCLKINALSTCDSATLPALSALLSKAMRRFPVHRRTRANMMKHRSTCSQKSRTQFGFRREDS
ncbi:unnamed protein product [Hapterophycus canaliculatus]